MSGDAWRRYKEAKETFEQAEREYVRSLNEPIILPPCEELSKEEMCQVLRQWFHEFKLWADEVHDFCWGDPEKSPPPPKTPPIG